MFVSYSFSEASQRALIPPLCHRGCCSSRVQHICPVFALSISTILTWVGPPHCLLALRLAPFKCTSELIFPFFLNPLKVCHGLHPCTCTPLAQGLPASPGSLLPAQPGLILTWYLTSVQDAFPPLFPTPPRMANSNSSSITKIRQHLLQGPSFTTKASLVSALELL